MTEEKLLIPARSRPYLSPCSLIENIRAEKVKFVTESLPNSYKISVMFSSRRHVSFGKGFVN
jgi:hypothetical protein